MRYVNNQQESFLSSMNKENPQRLVLPYKRDKLSVLMGCLLGDASIVKKYPNNLVICHTEQCKDYFDWKSEVLKSLGLQERKTRVMNLWNGNKVYIKDFVGEEVKWFRERFYVNNKRTIKNSLIRHLNPFGLAIWLMDDGHKVRRGYDYFCLNTQAYPYEQQQMLVSWFKKKYNFHVSIQKDKHCYKLYFGSKDNTSKRFITMVKPYIHPSMRYKIR